MSVLDGPLVFVDIETNGLNSLRGRIIEVAAIRVENGKIVDEFNRLIDPQTEIPDFISQLTGITAVDIAGAPTFYDIAGELHQFMDGAVFVAHNVRFDYSFLKQEFKRTGYKFNPKLLCTVKLSRAMYSSERGHKLQDLIDRCGLEVATRHRAWDDAHAMWQFINHLQVNFAPEAVNAAVSQQIRTPSLPKGLAHSQVTSLPEVPGVYIFQDERGGPLYIGKSVNIKKRVLSHFSRDHESESEFKITQTIANIEVRQTDGELQALLLESRLIKEQQPLYNRQLRRNQKMTLARKKLDIKGYISLSIEDTETIDPSRLDDILAVYTTKGKARSYFLDICKSYGLCPRLMGLEKGRGACFSYQLKRCGGACAGKVTAEAYNQLVMDVFENQKISQWPYKTPVLLQEISFDSEDYKSIVVDKWCVVAEVNQPEDCSPTISYREWVFDIDTYRILKTFIGQKRHRLDIKPISLASLQEMATA
jgi:DNA polymerase III subunit epsilon